MVLVTFDRNSAFIFFLNKGRDFLPCLKAEVFLRLITHLILLLNRKPFKIAIKNDLPHCFALAAVLELNAKYKSVISLLPTQYFY